MRRLWVSVHVLLALAVVTARVAEQPLLLRPEVRPPAFRADVIVVGGSPAGVAAALAAARQGMVVILVESRPFLGTVWTGAMLNIVDLNRLPGGRLLNGGIFAEIYRELGGITFDPIRVRQILLRKVEGEPGISLLLGVPVAQPIVESGRVIGAIARMPDGRDAIITAAVTIDATDDGDVVAAAGVPFTYGREARGLDRRAMAATLMFRVAGIAWPETIAFARMRRRERQPSGALRGYVWGFRDLMRDYRASDARLTAQDLNLGRLPDGSAWINALQVHEVDGLDPDLRRGAYVRAELEVPNLVEYLRARIPGFSRVRLVEVAPELYVRETRHLQGLYTLTVQDIGHSVRFWDSIGAASYPIDLHSYVPGEHHRYGPVRTPYAIPLRALVPAPTDGMFMASRAFSATWEAAGSARVVPTTMVMGEGVGVAAAVCVLRGVSPHGLVQRPDLVHAVQRRLVRAGAILDF